MEGKTRIEKESWNEGMIKSPLWGIGNYNNVQVNDEKELG